MPIREANPDDAPDIEAFASAIWEGHDIMGRPGLHGAGSLIALEGQALVGAATARRGRRDSATVVVHVDVARDHRRRGLGSELLNQLISANPARLYVGRALESQSGALEFALAHHFREAERALEGWIEPHLAVEWMRRELGEAANVVRPAAAGEEESAAALIAETYRRTHPWNPPAPLTPEEAQEAFLVNAIEGSLAVAVDGDTLLGAACLSAPGAGSEGTAWLVWVGTEPDGPTWVTDSLVAACLGTAATRGLRVRVEVNNHHPALWAAVAGLPGAKLEQDLVVLTRSA